jgi:hypothetical protein
LSGECKDDRPGVYAIKTTIDVWWRDENNSTPLFDPGRGKITVFSKAEVNDLCEDGSDGTATIQACGDIVPPILVSANCGVVQIVFPDEMWDAPTMPKFTGRASTNGFAPTDTLTIQQTLNTFGITLMTPDATWPTYMETTTFSCAAGTGGQCFPDTDNDGKPGITVKLKQDGMPFASSAAEPYGCDFFGSGWAYSTAPVSVLGGLDKASGAVETYIGLRTKIGGAATPTTQCGSGTGDATVESFESRLFGCKKKSADCKPADEEFVDQNLPNYHVLQKGTAPSDTWKTEAAKVSTSLDQTGSVGPRSSMVRLGDVGTTFSCAQVREATFE